MPLFNDRRNDGPAEDIPTIPTSVGPRKDYGPSPFKGNAPSGYSPNRETAFNNPLSPHFTGKKTPIPGVKGGFNVEYKDWPTPKKQEPVNKYTAQNQHLDKIYATRGKQFGVPRETSKNVSTLTGKINKVGPDSPRYPQLIGAKARQVAGYMKKTDKITQPSGGYGGQFTQKTDPKWWSRYAVPQMKQQAAEQLSTRKFIMSYGDNPTRAKKTK
jgi:hypothetical protein